MHTPTKSPDKHSPIKKTVSERVRQWKDAAARVRELVAAGPTAENVAQDLGISSNELRALAAKGADAANELPCLLEALRIDVQTLAAKEPLVLRDLQRVCSLCDQKRECDRDIAAGTLATHYQSYCANADTVKALELDPTFSSPK